jgi:ABC-2 type transport system ATP-binding protein
MSYAFMPMIRAENLTKIYRTYKKKPGLAGALQGLFHRDYEQTTAAHQVNFTVEEGELVGFLGPNGAGKTTVLKMLSGLLFPTSGTASVLGYCPWDRADAYKRQFALLLGQKNQLWWDLPALESFELNRQIYGIAPAAYDQTLNDLVDLLEVRDKLRVMVRELSLGERMKMELIAALLHGPRVLFLDEPTIGLDVVSQKKVRDFLRSYTRERKITTLLTSHYMADIQELCQRVIIIDHGRIFFDGQLSQVIERFALFKLVTFTCAQGFNGFDFLWAGEIVESSPVSVRLKVQRDKLTTVCREVMNRFELTDLNVQETPVEEVIRQVFTSHREAVAQAVAQV